MQAFKQKRTVHRHRPSYEIQALTKLLFNPKDESSYTVDLTLRALPPRNCVGVALVMARNARVKAL
jgi:hypothetical protein